METRCRYYKHIQQIFQRIGKFGFNLNKRKCQFFGSKAKYLGLISDAKVHRPDTSKTSIFKNMPGQINVSLQSLLWPRKLLQFSSDFKFIIERICGKEVVQRMWKYFKDIKKTCCHLNYR